MWHVAFMGDTQFWWGNLKERDHSRNLDIGKGIILELVLKK
jgi:hypothetical protein